MGLYLPDDRVLFGPENLRGRLVELIIKNGLCVADSCRLLRDGGLQLCGLQLRNLLFIPQSEYLVLTSRLRQF